MRLSPLCRRLLTAVACAAVLLPGPAAGAEPGRRHRQHAHRRILRQPILLPGGGRDHALRGHLHQARDQVRPSGALGRHVLATGAGPAAVPLRRGHVRVLHHGHHVRRSGRARHRGSEAVHPVLRAVGRPAVDRPAGAAAGPRHRAERSVLPRIAQLLRGRRPGRLAGHPGPPAGPALGREPVAPPGRSRGASPGHLPCGVVPHADRLHRGRQGRRRRLVLPDAGRGSEQRPLDHVPAPGARRGRTWDHGVHRGVVQRAAGVHGPAELPPPGPGRR